MNQECSDLSYLIQNSIDAIFCKPVSDNEWILVFARMYFIDNEFNTFINYLINYFIDYGVYVDIFGRRSRSLELQFPTQPLYCASLEAVINGKLCQLICAFSSTHIDVFDLCTTHWVQTINLKATRPLQQHGVGYVDN